MAQIRGAAHRTGFCCCHQVKVRVGIISLHIACIVVVCGTELVDLLHDLDGSEKILQICGISLVADHNGLSAPLLRKAGLNVILPI